MKRDDEPRGRAAKERAEAARTQAKKQLDSLFGNSQSAEATRLANVMRDAQGTPGFAEACRTYHDTVGIPSDPAILSMLLDCGDPGLILETLSVVEAATAEGELVLTAGMKTQLRMLSNDPDDDIAETAEEILESD